MYIYRHIYIYIIQIRTSVRDGRTPPTSHMYMYMYIYNICIYVCMYVITYIVYII